MSRFAAEIEVAAYNIMTSYILPVFASGAMSLGPVSVAGNAQRLKRVKR